MSEDTRRAAEEAARSSYGKLIAILASLSRDIAAAEDALSDAFAAALKAWPEQGVPERPEAWLLTAARNRLSNMRRHDRVRAAAAAAIEADQTPTPDRDNAFPDERLKLLFVCAHPAIDPSVRTPLMLQTVLGLDAERIASAFLTSPAAMAQRLVRAKAKIKAAALRFETPDPADANERTTEVLDAVYAAFGAGWEAASGSDHPIVQLTEESIYLARLIALLLPADPEAKGLLALMLFCHARRSARRDAPGRFVPLDRQDPSLWDAGMIAEADGLLTAAAAKTTFGRYQCMAAIQSVHAQRAVTGEPNHQALDLLYRMLAAHDPSPGVRVAQAAAWLEAGRPAEALSALEALAGAAERYQPYWATRWRCLEALGRSKEARVAHGLAVALTEDASVRAYLIEQAPAPDR